MTAEAQDKYLQGRKIVTEIKEAGKWWPAEDYHQQYRKLIVLSVRVAVGCKHSEARKRGQQSGFDEGQVRGELMTQLTTIPVAMSAPHTASTGRYERMALVSRQAGYESGRDATMIKQEGDLAKDRSRQ